MSEETTSKSGRSSSDDEAPLVDIFSSRAVARMSSIQGFPHWPLSVKSRYRLHSRPLHLVPPVAPVHARREGSQSLPPLAITSVLLFHGQLVRHYIQETMWDQGGDKSLHCTSHQQKLKTSLTVPTSFFIVGRQTTADYRNRNKKSIISFMNVISPIPLRRINPLQRFVILTAPRRLRKIMPRTWKSLSALLAPSFPPNITYFQSPSMNMPTGNFWGSWNPIIGLHIPREFTHGISTRLKVESAPKRVIYSNSI